MAEQAQSQHPREPVEQLAPTAPERPIPPWLILPEALLAGVALVTILVSQTNLVARGELEQALDQAFERGFAAAADIERSIDDRSIGQADAAGYLLGLAEGARIARQRAADPRPIFPVDPVRFLSLPLSFFESCPANVPLWLIGLFGIDYCGDGNASAP